MSKTDVAADFFSFETSKPIFVFKKFTGSTFFLSGFQLHPEWQAPEPRVQRHHVGVSLRGPGRPGVSVLSGVVRPDPLPSHRGTSQTCLNALITVKSLKRIQIALPRLLKTTKKTPSEYYATGARVLWRHTDSMTVSSSWLCHLFLFCNPSRTSVNTSDNTFNKYENALMMDNQESM